MPAVSHSCTRSFQGTRAIQIVIRQIGSLNHGPCGMKKNHTVCALVDSFLEANPEKARDSEELKDMYSRSKITDEMVRYPLDIIRSKY